MEQLEKAFNVALCSGMRKFQKGTQNLFQIPDHVVVEKDLLSLRLSQTASSHQVCLAACLICPAFLV